MNELLSNGRTHNMTLSKTVGRGGAPRTLAVQLVKLKAPRRQKIVTTKPARPRPQQ